MFYSTKLFRNCTQRSHPSAIKLHGIWEAARNVHNGYFVYLYISYMYNINIFWYVQFSSGDQKNLIWNALFWTFGFLYIKIFCGGVHVIQNTGSIRKYLENLGIYITWFLFWVHWIISLLKTYNRLRPAAKEIDKLNPRLSEAKLATQTWHSINLPSAL